MIFTHYIPFLLIISMGNWSKSSSLTSSPHAFSICRVGRPVWRWKKKQLWKIIHWMIGFRMANLRISRHVFFDKFGPSDPLQSAWDLSHFVLELRSSHMFEVSSEKKKTLVFTCPINRHIANRKTGILRDIAATSKHISRRYYWSRQYVFHQDQRETASHHWIPGTEKVWKFQTIRWDHRTVPNPDWLLVSNMVWNGFI